VVIAALSLWLTPETHREANDFTWEPIREVAKLFAGIFVSIIPVLAMLQAGRSGALSWLLSVVTERDGSPNEVAYFWLTGLLSAFLDNVPTYLVFFELAGGNAQEDPGRDAIARHTAPVPQPSSRIRPVTGNPIFVEIVFPDFHKFWYLGTVFKPFDKRGLFVGINVIDELP